MIPILLYILYKKKGKQISRTAKKVLSKANPRKVLKKTEGGKRRIKNVYSKFRNRRLNRKGTGD